MAGMVLKLGAKLQSAVCDTQIMVLTAPKTEVDLCCGGVPMTVAGAEQGDAEAVEAMMTETLTGKRYVDGEETMEFLCTKGGVGGLSIGETPLQVKQPKALPSSD